MAATLGTSGFGTLLKRDGVTVAEVKTISGPNLSMEVMDATHMESPGGFREVLPSFKSAGEVTFDVNFLPAPTYHQLLITDFKNRTKQSWQVVWPDTDTVTWSFSGYVTGFQPKAGVDTVLEASVTITVTGDVTIS